MSTRQSHLEMIQGVINRLSNNSFLLKGWSVVLVSALFALAAKDTNRLFVYVAYFPCVVFWILDGYFLRQEKLFRALYDHVRHLADSQIDYSMDTSVVADQVGSWIEIVFSLTLRIFHGAVFFTIFVVMLVSIWTKTG